MRYLRFGLMACAVAALMAGCKQEAANDAAAPYFASALTAGEGLRDITLGTVYDQIPARMGMPEYSYALTNGVPEIALSYGGGQVAFNLEGQGGCGATLRSRFKYIVQYLRTPESLYEQYPECSGHLVVGAVTLTRAKNGQSSFTGPIRGGDRTDIGFGSKATDVMLAFGTPDSRGTSVSPFARAAMRSVQSKPLVYGRKGILFITGADAMTIEKIVVFPRTL
jgi:hypothetical protein